MVKFVIFPRLLHPSRSLVIILLKKKYFNVLSIFSLSNHCRFVYVCLQTSFYFRPRISSLQSQSSPFCCLILRSSKANPLVDDCVSMLSSKWFILSIFWFRWMVAFHALPLKLFTFLSLIPAWLCCNDAGPTSPLPIRRPPSQFLFRSKEFSMNITTSI